MARKPKIKKVEEEIVREPIIEETKDEIVEPVNETPKEGPKETIKDNLGLKKQIIEYIISLSRKGFSLTSIVTKVCYFWKLPIKSKDLLKYSNNSISGLINTIQGLKI